MHFIDESLVDLYDIIDFIKAEIKYQEERLVLQKSNHLFFTNRFDKKLDEVANSAAADSLVTQFGIETSIGVLNRLLRELNDKHNDYILSQEEDDHYESMAEVELALGTSAILA